MKLPCRIIEYLPEFLRDIREYKQIAHAEDIELNRLELRRRKILENTFIEDLDEEGTSRWEGMLGLKPKDAETLEDRKFRIKGCMFGRRPYTYEEIVDRLNNLCGKENISVELKAEQYIVKIRVGLKVKNRLQEILDILNTAIPCNMLIDYDLQYNTYSTLSKYTHGTLKKYTYGQLRDEHLTEV